MPTDASGAGSCGVGSEEKVGRGPTVAVAFCAGGSHEVHRAGAGAGVAQGFGKKVLPCCSGHCSGAGALGADGAAVHSGRMGGTKALDGAGGPLLAPPFATDLDALTPDP